MNFYVCKLGEVKNHNSNELCTKKEMFSSE